MSAASAQLQLQLHQAALHSILFVYTLLLFSPSKTEQDSFSTALSLLCSLRGVPRHTYYSTRLALGCTCRSLCVTLHRADAPRFLHCTASGTSRSSKPCHSGCCESRSAAEIAGEKAEKRDAQKESAENGSRQQRIIRNQENGRPHSRLRTATGNPTFIHSRCPRPPRSRSRSSPWITFIAALRSPLETHRPAEERLDARCSPSAPAAFVRR